MRFRTDKSPKAPKSSNTNNRKFAAARNFSDKTGEFFATRKGMFLIALGIVFGIYLFNTVFGDLVGPIVVIVILMVIGHAQKWHLNRRAARLG